MPLGSTRHTFAPNDCLASDGKSISLSDIIRMGIVVVPNAPPVPPTSPLSSSTSGHSPDHTSITDPTSSKTDHIPLTPGSPFPLLIRDSNPVLGSSLAFVWTIHPCAVGTHVGELVGDTNSSEGEGKRQGDQDDQVDDDRSRARRVERWMDIWLGLHSRILHDLAR